MCAKIKNEITSEIRNGDLITLEINGLRVSGHWFSVEGANWLLQPNRWIRITNPAGVQIISIIEKGGALEPTRAR